MSDTNLDQLVELTNRIARSTVALIDTMTQRGAFKGEELTTVGTLRDQALQATQLAEQVEASKGS